ncbi:MAG: hypothetical protein KDA78_06905 [Planctomycetaceae bacterium]|nr:hypothetical protein [Planctomycetaceae bacterium]
MLRSIVLIVLCASLTCLTPCLAAKVETVLGNGTPGYSGDGGPASQATCREPFGVVIGPSGSLYVCETKNHVIRQINLKTGIVRTLAGTGKAGYSGDAGLATAAELNEPYEVRFDKSGNMFFVEMMNHVVRSVEMNFGIIVTVAGTGKMGYGGDGGPAKEALLNRPHSIALDADQNLYICDIGNHRLRVVDPKTHKIQTILGNGQKKPLPADAMLGNIAVSGPRALDYDGSSLWLALREGNAVYRIDMKSKRIHHIAGLGGGNGYKGDGGPAIQAMLAGPKGIAVDPQGNVVIADTESHTIRRIDGKTGIITTLVGTGQKGDGPDGDPLKCKLDRPHSVCFGPDGSVYIGDSNNHRVRRWIPE